MNDWPVRFGFSQRFGGGWSASDEAALLRWWLRFRGFQFALVGVVASLVPVSKLWRPSIELRFRVSGLLSAPG